MNPHEVTVPEADDGAGDAPVRLGHFELGRQLGAGGMGVVFEARDTMLDRQVALKLLKPSSRAGAQARLVREAQALARLQHPNVVAVFEIGLAGNEIFAAMELVDGTTLREWVKEPRSWREITDVFVAAGRGLAAVHALGLVHRDFKPSNVLIDRRNTPKVSDFGLVALANAPTETELADPPSVPAGSDDHTLTAAGIIMGTPAYMAPEQRRGERCDARADQFSFAITLVEALTGRLPEAGGLDALPKALRPILSRALATDRADRYSTMASLLADLERVRRGSAWRWLAAGSVVAIATIVAAAWSFGKTMTPDPCPPPDEQVTAMWGVARQAEVRAHLAVIDPVQGAARFAAANRVIEPFVSAWRAMHIESCRATRVRGAQSDTLFDLRLRCLRHRADELDYTVAAAAFAANPAALDAAIAGLVQLTPTTACGDTAALLRSDDHPLDPAARADADELASRIKAIEVDERADRLVGLPARSSTIVVEARALGHPRTLTAALAAHARVQLSVDQSKEAVTTLRELTQVAASSHQDRDEAYAWTRLIGVLAFNQSQPEDALALVPAASAAVLRAGDPTDLRTDLLYNEAIILDAGPAVDKALERLAQARRLLEEAGADHAGSPLASRLESVLFEIGNAQSIAGDQDAAVATFRMALDRSRALYGADSVSEAIGLHNMAEALRLAARYTEALVALRDAARINEARSGESSRLASNLVSIATTLGDQGVWEEALATYDRALRIFRAHLHPDDVQLSAVLVGRAMALGHVDRLEDARAAYAEVIGLLERAGATTMNLPIAYFNRGELSTRLGRCPDALADYARAAESFIAHGGATTSYLLYPLVGQGRCLVRTRRAAQAIAPLERAVGLKGNEGDALQAALAQVWLGRALVEAGRDKARGTAMVRTARARVAAAARTDPDAAAELRDLDRWLTTR
jgi:eukaryotic-like serine/threonine-protein kinase